MSKDTMIPESDKKELYELSMPDKNFVSSYQVAEQIVSNAVESHRTYHDIIRACQKHIGGEKPIPPDELKKKGMAWVWNFNYNKASAKIEKGTAESISKVSSAISLGYVTFINFDEKKHRKDDVLSFLEDSQKRGIVASVLGYALYCTLSKETRLSGWLNEIEYPTYAFGFCALIYDKFDWMPEPTHPLNVAFKPKTKPDDIREWVTFKNVDATELFDRWITARNEKVQADKDPTARRITSSGWNLEGLENVLLKAFSGKTKDGKVPESWEQVVPLYVNDPSLVIGQTSNVSIAKIYHRELNGTLSEVYIPYNNTWQASDTRQVTVTVDVNQIIFSKNHGKYVQKNHITIIRDSGFTSESGYIQDYRGIAKYAVEDGIRYNRVRNGIGNKMQFVGAPMFEPSNTGGSDKFKVTVSQGFVLLPPSHNIIEKQPAFDINSHINVLRFEEGEFTRDTQQFDASIQGRLTSRPNKGEVERVTAEVEFTDSAKNNIKFRDYAETFNTVLTRIPSVKCKETDPGYSGKKRFYEIVKKELGWLIETDAEVDKILKCIDSYTMDPVVGSIETITIAMQMAETPFARNRLKRMFLVAKGMPIEEVNIAVPLITDKFTNLSDSRIAAFENDMFFTTNEVVISGTDDHIVHIDSHFAKAVRIIQGVQQQALSPVDAFKYLENNLAHGRLHIDMLGQNPIYNTKAQEYEGQFKQLIQAKDQIKKQAEAMMQQQQAEAQKMQLDPKTEAEIAEKNAKAQSDMQRKDWLAQQRTEQANQKIEQSHEQQMRRIELDAEAKRQANGQ